MDDKKKDPPKADSAGTGMWYVGGWQLPLYKSMHDILGVPVRGYTVESGDHYYLTVNTNPLLDPAMWDKGVADALRRVVPVAHMTLRKVNSVLGYSGELWIHPEFRGRGLYRPLNIAKFSIAKMIGFKSLIATVQASNIREMRAATNNGWVQVGTMQGESGQLNLIQVNLL